MTPEALSLLKHSLRTPLNHILGYAEMAAEHPAAQDPTLQASLSTVQSSARQIEELIRSELKNPAETPDDVAFLRSAMRPPLDGIASAVASLRKVDLGPEFTADIEKIGFAARQLEVFSREGSISGVQKRVFAPPELDSALPPLPILSGRVLIVDDDEGSRDLLTRMLEREGFEVVAESSGEAALERLKSQSYDVALLNIMMPGMDGFEVLTRIKADRDTKDLPVVAVTGLDDIETAMRAIGLGADDFMVKPFDPVLLRVRIGAILRRGEAESQRARLAEDLQLILESTGEGIYGLDVKGRCMFVNRAATEVLGYSREDLIGRNLHRLIHHSKADGSPYPMEECPATTVLTTGEPRQGSAEVMFRADGAMIPVQYTAHPMRRGGRVEGVVVTFSDISERKRTEEKLLQSAKLESLGVMAGGIAHDFNNLLTGILGNASLALETMTRSDPNHELLEEIVTASERAADLTRQMLAFAGKGQFVIELVDVSEMIEQIAELLAASLPKTARFSMRLARNLPLVEGDLRQLQQLVFNLVVNAGEAVGERQGIVEVTTGARELEHGAPGHDSSFERLPPGRYAFISVRDSGSGMDEATRTRIFDPFFTTKFTGRGLGLPAALGIVQSHHGGIRFETEPGIGSTFEVLMPVAKESLSAGQGAIMVVDDEEIVRRSTRAALERKGYRVMVAENGKTAIEIFRRESAGIALVLLDLTMPVMGGDEALRYIHAMRPDVPVIISSGYQESEVARRFAGTRVSGFLRKPYTPSTLVERIGSVLNSRKIGNRA